MIGTAAKLIAAVGKLLAGEAPMLVATSMFVMYFGIAMCVGCGGCVVVSSLLSHTALTGWWSRYTTMALPHFSRFMNQFRVAASMLVAYVSLGSMVLVGTQLHDTGAFSFLWFSAGAFVVVGACGLPVLRCVCVVVF